MKNIIQECRDLVCFQRARDDEVGCSNAFADGQPVDDPRVVLTLHFEAKPSVHIEFHILKANLCHFMLMMRPERTSDQPKYHEMEKADYLISPAFGVILSVRLGPVLVESRGPKPFVTAVEALIPAR